MYVLTPKSALFTLSVPIFAHKLPRSEYSIYENSYKLNKETAQFHFSFPYPFA